MQNKPNTVDCYINETLNPHFNCDFILPNWINTKIGIFVALPPLLHNENKVS